MLIKMGVPSILYGIIPRWGIHCTDLADPADARPFSFYTSLGPAVCVSYLQMYKKRGK